MNKFSKRLLLVAGLLTVGFSLIWILPRDGARRLSCLSQDLPESMGQWLGERGRPAGKELKILAEDTEFSRMTYSHPTKPSVEVSVVFSGRDVNNSIHRPERCLKAQGWNFITERTVTIKSGLNDAVDIPFREIICRKPSFDADREPIMLANGEQRHDYRIQYYTFFGAKDVVESHYGRAMTDIKDRLVGGFDQQWAYATFSIPVMQKYADQGIAIAEHLKGYGMEESEEVLTEIITELLPLVVDVEFD